MKITISKKKSPYNKSFAGVQVKSSEDGPNLRDILQALADFKDKDFLNLAFSQNNVSAWAKIGTRFHPLGNISKTTFDDFLSLKES